ncbi:MAG TPA: hypothetical protein EYQ66_13260 [Myxococcales bacterium]|nr:hypothetical protein [Myxococcales bacterium]
MANPWPAPVRIPALSSPTLSSPALNSPALSSPALSSPALSSRALGSESSVSIQRREHWPERLEADTILPMTDSDRQKPQPGYWPSAWPVECGGNRRQKARAGRLDATSGDAEVVFRNTGRWNIMAIERDPGQWFVGGTMAASASTSTTAEWKASFRSATRAAALSRHRSTSRNSIARSAGIPCAAAWRGSIPRGAASPWPGPWPCGPPCSPWSFPNRANS